MTRVVIGPTAVGLTGTMAVRGATPGAAPIRDDCTRRRIARLGRERECDPGRQGQPGGSTTKEERR
jgi:hypothetical protein